MLYGKMRPGCERQDRPVRIPAVADADLVSGQSRYLDAVAVGEAKGALDPDHVHLLTHSLLVTGLLSGCRDGRFMITLCN